MLGVVVFLVVIKHAKYKGMPHEPVVAVNIKEVLSCNMLFVAPTQPAQPRPSGREFMKTACCDVCCLVGGFYVLSG